MFKILEINKPFLSPLLVVSIRDINFSIVFSIDGFLMKTVSRGIYFLLKSFAPN